MQYTWGKKCTAWGKIHSLLFCSFYPTPVRGMLPFFFLAIQYNFNRLHNLAQLLALSMLSLKFWHFLTWPRSISSALPHSGHVGESFIPNLFRYCHRQSRLAMRQELTEKTLNSYSRWNNVFSYCLPSFAFHVLWTSNKISTVYLVISATACWYLYVVSSWQIYCIFG